VKHSMAASARLWALLAAAALGGCLAGTIEGAGDQLPTISYDLNSLDEFPRAQERAKQWCRDNFDRDARLVSESDYDDADSSVTFECFVE
jgi:hypothetical protein